MATETTHFVYDGADVVRDLNANLSTAADCLNGPGIDNKLRQTVSGTASYFIQDHLGTTRGFADASGNGTSSLSYDSFGNVSSGSTPTRYTYTGRESDSETGLYYYRARYYDPALGRFISEDPLQFNSGDTNFYAYVWNSPTNWVDPSGLRPGDKYRNLRCAGWHAILDINMTSRHRTPAFPNGREYGGWMYQNADGTYSYTAPVPGGPAGVQISQFNPVPQGAVAAADYHTHGAYDPHFNGQGIQPGQPGYNWHNDGNEIFSIADMDSNEAEGAHGLPGFLGTPRGTIEEYIPLAGHPHGGQVLVLTKQNCGCP